MLDLWMCRMFLIQWLGVCDCVSVYVYVCLCISEEMRVWRWRGTSRKRGKRFAQIQLIQNTRLGKVFAGISVLLRRRTSPRRIPQLRQRRRRRHRWRWWWRSPGDELHAPCRDDDDDVKKADEYWWEWGMACLPRAPPSHHGANLAWGLMTDDDDGNTTVIQNGDLSQLLACHTVLFFHLTFASHHLYLLPSFWGRMVAHYTLFLHFPWFDLLLHFFWVVLFKLRSVHPTAFLLTFRLASDAVLSCCFHYDFRMTFFGTHIFIYSDIFCCCFLNFYPIL